MRFPGRLQGPVHAAKLVAQAVSGGSGDAGQVAALAAAHDSMFQQHRQSPGGCWLAGGPCWLPTARSGSDSAAVHVHVAAPATSRSSHLRHPATATILVDVCQLQRGAPTSIVIAGYAAAAVRCTNLSAGQPSLDRERSSERRKPLLRSPVGTDAHKQTCAHGGGREKKAESRGKPLHFSRLFSVPSPKDQEVLPVGDFCDASTAQQRAAATSTPAATTARGAYTARQLGARKLQP